MVNYPEKKCDTANFVEEKKLSPTTGARKRSISFEMESDSDGSLESASPVKSMKDTMIFYVYE